MDSGGRIWTPEEVAKMEHDRRVALGLIPIPAKALVSLQAMTVQERQTWHAKQKAKRLAAKRARQARRANR